MSQIKVHIVRGALSDDLYKFLIAQLADKAEHFPACSHVVSMGYRNWVDEQNGQFYTAKSKGWLVDENTGEVIFEPGQTIFPDDMERAQAYGFPIGAFEFSKID